MIEIFLLAGSISIDLEPYAVENQDSDTYGQGTNTDADGKAFQWSSRRDQSGNPIIQDKDGSNSNGDGIKRDQFGRPVESGN